MPKAPFQVLVIPWRRTPRFEVAVLHRGDSDVWQFVSGGGEDGESVTAAAAREALEEIGASSPVLALDSTCSVPASWFAAWQSWPAKVIVIPEHAFAVEATDVVLSSEHRAVRWLGITAAMSLLTFDSNKTALWELHERMFPARRAPTRAYDTSHAPGCACGDA